MFQLFQSYRNKMMGPQARRGVQQNPRGSFPLAQEEIQRLNSCLEMENARLEDNQSMADLEAKLEEMDLKIKQEEALRERLLNEAEEVKRELEKLEREEREKREDKSSDPAVLHAAVIAPKFHENVKYMKKKSLQQEYEELKVAHLLSQEAFLAEVQAERKKSEALQEELNQLQTSYKELSSKYEAEVTLVRQEAESQKFYEARLREEQRLLENLRAEKDKMFQDMSQKVAVLQDSETLLKEELYQLKNSYDKLNCNYQSEISGLKQDMETFWQEIRQEKDANLERQKENLQLINNLRAEKEELFQTMSREIKIRQKREEQMLHELHQVHVSCEQLKSRYETDTMHLKQQAETYQEDMKQERKALLDKSEEDKALLDNLRTEYAVLQKNTTTEIKFLLEKERNAQAELENVKGLYQELNCWYETYVTALKQQAEQHQQEISGGKTDLEGAKEDLLQPDTLRDEKVDFQPKPNTVSKEMAEDSQSQVDPVKVSSPEVSSEELSAEPLSDCSTDPEPTNETEIAAKTVLEELDHPDTQTKQDGKKKKSKISIWKKSGLESSPLQQPLTVNQRGSMTTGQTVKVRDSFESAAQWQTFNNMTFHLN
ncbi:trichohyalin-like [Gambusia affinis]|uniref:trichohyalin-like n=1 Tax=Gambusia affinis TaxID=33528 RepID=UPI001CDC994D|nr:trichohyalin-like [Gambusia affinis]